MRPAGAAVLRDVPGSGIARGYLTETGIWRSRSTNEAHRVFNGSGRMNVFIETSGRDTSMFDYVDFCFPKQDYNKLVVHFTINEIAYAQTSVDKRMSFEMKKGKEALKEGGVERVLGLIQANSGGPFGSAHLPDIQKASSITHEAIFNKNSSLCSDWYKAHILIEGKDDQPWTAVANVKNCTVFTFLSSIMFKNGRADIRREVKY